MLYPETKIYFDGSHYIGIPKTKRKIKYRPKPPEELIEVQEENINLTDNENYENEKEENNLFHFEEVELQPGESLPFEEDETVIEVKNKLSKKGVKRITKKELFNELYIKYLNLKKKQRKEIIIEEMLIYFKTREQCEEFVEHNFERKQRNLICRRIRMTRKANLANFNYFCTFTYDNKLHTEESFKRKLRGCFKMMCHRKGWKYMGVWERAPKTNRLHFHGLFNIPEGTLPGKIKVVKSFSTRIGKIQYSYQSSYFNERFGRSDFKKIDEYENKLGSALAYLMKYIEKTGEKIVYSKNLPQYFVSDILEDDIICKYGLEDKKILLFDNFKCLKEGEYMGEVSKEVIEKMPKSN